jgi:hypothetical protein
MRLAEKLDWKGLNLSGVTDRLTACTGLKLSLSEHPFTPSGGDYISL